MMGLDGVIDLHVHAGPDVRPRKTTALELARAACAAGLRGFLFKNHHAPTVVSAAALREAVPGLEVFGGLALNESVGGLNPAAVEAARACGVRKVLVNHPEIEFLNLSPTAQRELAGPGVWFERCAVCVKGALDWDGFAAGIRAVGVETTVLATDLGQPENPDPITGMKEMLAQLARRDFTYRELEVMACRNPAVLLGLR